jgi:GST-like protein
MTETTDALVLDLVEWIGREPRPYSDVIETWRTSCPRLTIWEDAVDRGYVARKPGPGRAFLSRSPHQVKNSCASTAASAEPITFAREAPGGIDSNRVIWPNSCNRMQLTACCYRMGNAPMIDLYYWTTPNGHKITMFLEETGLSYKVFPVNIGKGEQFKPEFLAIAPNNRIPAMVDHEPKGGGKPISIFESGAMLLYLAEKTGKFLPRISTAAMTRSSGRSGRWAGSADGRAEPSLPQLRGGKNQIRHRPLRQRDQPALRRAQQAPRRPRVHRRRYSIADMASYPWIVPYKNQDQNIDDFPHLKRWLETIRRGPPPCAPTPRRKRSIRISASPSTAPKRNARSCLGRPRPWCGRHATIIALRRHHPPTGRANARPMTGSGG